MNMKRQNAKTLMRRILRRSGFTLIELVTCIAVGVVICGSAGSLVWNATIIRTEASNRGEMVNAASAALELMLRYFREILQDECPANPTPCNLGNAQVSTATATQLRFGNYGFRLTSTNLEMTTDNAANWYTAAKYVSSLAFSYYNKSGTALTSFPLSSTDRAAIRRVVIAVSMTRGSQTVSVRCGLYLRCFMNEASP